jgi:hypothetical protein
MVNRNIENARPFATIGRGGGFRLSEATPEETKNTNDYKCRHMRTFAYFSPGPASHCPAVYLLKTIRYGVSSRTEHE